MPRKTSFKEMPWPAIEARVRQCDIAIIPLGSMEPQPPHLPVGTDTYIIEALCQRGAALAADDMGALVLPAFDVGSPVGPALNPLALNLPWDVMIDLLVGIFTDLYRQGFRRFALVNGHGSTAILQSALVSSADPDDGKPRMGGEGYSYQTAFGFAYDAAAQFVENGPDAEMFFVSAGAFFRGVTGVTPAGWWQSGGEGDLPLPVKTSLMLALQPQLVDLSKMPATEMVYSTYSFLAHPRYGMGGVFHYSRLNQIENPVEASVGPFDVSADIGEQLIAIWAEKFAAVLRDLQAKAHLKGRYRPEAYKSGQP